MAHIGRGGLWVLVAVALVAAGAHADERADWGVVVSVGTADYTLLLESSRGYALVAVDPYGTIQGPKASVLTFTDIRPGDRVDYAWSPWAGMMVADVLHVTPRIAPGRPGGPTRAAEPAPAARQRDVV